MVSISAFFILIGMSLEVGIVGLPNVGKSTLFNALTAAGALAANYPFATIEPNVGIVAVPDSRLETIRSFIPTEKLVPAAVRVVDIAGIVRGASTGEGLGNKFLSHIREVDAILHVVRCFEGTDILHVEGSVDPIRDIDTIDTELALADLDTASSSLDKTERLARGGDKEAVAKAELLRKCKAQLNDGKAVRALDLNADEKKLLRSLGLITAKKCCTLRMWMKAISTAKARWCRKSVIVPNWKAAPSCRSAASWNRNFPSWIRRIGWRCCKASI